MSCIAPTSSALRTGLVPMIGIHLRCDVKLLPADNVFNNGVLIVTDVFVTTAVCLCVMWDTFLIDRTYKAGVNPIRKCHAIGQRPDLLLIHLFSNP